MIAAPPPPPWKHDIILYYYYYVHIIICICGREKYLRTILRGNVVAFGRQYIYVNEFPTDY